MGGVDRGRAKRAVQVYRWLGTGGPEGILGRIYIGQRGKRGLSRNERDRRVRIEIECVRRFWVRKTEPWAAIRRDSKREERRIRNLTISNSI